MNCYPLVTSAYTSVKYEFEKRFQCERHIVEQNSGVGYTCGQCKQVLTQTWQPSTEVSVCFLHFG